MLPDNTDRPSRRFALVIIQQSIPAPMLVYLRLIGRKTQNQAVFELSDTRLRLITATNPYTSVRYNAVAPSFMQCPHVSNVRHLAAPRIIDISSVPRAVLEMSKP